VCAVDSRGDFKLNYNYKLAFNEIEMNIDWFDFDAY